MFTIRKLILFSLSLLLVGTLSLSVPHPEEAQAQVPPGQHIVYNLYATDGFITLANGTVVYTYGFVGGREGPPPPSPPVPLSYQVSARARVNPGGIGTLPNGSPAPTPGIMTAAETPLFGNAQFPAPVIYAAVGDVVEIRLKNLGVSNKVAPNDPHSIHLHGLDVNAANDGVPETSLGAIPANAAMPGAGNIVVYMFTADRPGTYMYHCHQEADIHVQMGMYGALVIYDPNDPAVNPNPIGGCPPKFDLQGLPIPCGKGPGSGQGGTLWGWAYDKDYILLLSEFDLGQHVAEQFNGTRGGYNPVNYKPQYWFINGLSFPNTIHAAAGVVPFNWNTWITTHPGYDPFIVGSVNAASLAGTPGDKVLLRTINMGFQTQPMHMHGFHGKIIGSDQRAWSWAQPNQPVAGAGTPGIGMEKNTLTIGSGETYEWLLDFGTWNGHVFGYYPDGTGPDPIKGEMGTFAGGTQSRYTIAGPSSNMNLADPAIPDPFAPGRAYVGGPVVGPDNQASQGTGGLPPELPFTTGQYFPFHNHDDYKATNNGVYPGGMFTMIMTQP